MTSRQLDEERIFHFARELTDAEALAEYLDQVCAGDQALRDRVEELLRVYEQEQSFLKSNGDPPATEAIGELNIAAGQQIGRYKLLQKIGEGGFGVVFMAEQSRPVRRKVAIKVIKPGMDSQAVVARFEAERQALAMMDHPNIARVFDGGATDGGRPYFVMELVKGVPITEYCDKNELSTEQRLKLFTTVCQAVQHAHQKGIIHRDLKPSNVLVTLADGEPVVKVIDFGVAKATNQQLTEKTLFTAFGQMVGTPQYMSPEQAEMSCLDVDTRSDVYSLGVLLYELLTGTTPLESERLRTAGYAEMQRLIREEEPPKPSTRLSTSGDKLTILAKHRKVTPEKLKSQVKGDLDWIVMKALEKDRNRRYESPSSLGDDIGRLLNDEPVEACPPSRSYRLRKFIRRNRLAVTVALLLVLTLSLGFAGTVSQWLEAREQAIVANQRARELQEAKNELQVEYLNQKVEMLLSGGQLQQSKDDLRRILEEWQVQLLLGLDAHNALQWNQALEHIEQAELLDDSLAIRGIKLYFLLLNGESDRFEVEISKLLEGQPKDYLDYLFVGNALSFRDSKKGLELVETAINIRNSPYAQKVLAEIYQALAYDENEMAHAEKSLELADAVCTLDPDNENFLAMLLASQLTCLQFRQLEGVDTNALLREARLNAARVGKQRDFAMAQYLAGSFHTLMGEHERAAGYFDSATEKGTGFHFVAAASSHLRLGEKVRALELLRAGGDDSDFNLVALAEVLAVTKANVNEAINIYNQLKFKRPPSESPRAIWTIPESILLAAGDLPGAKANAKGRLQEQQGQMSDWEVAQLRFLIEDTSEASIGNLIASVDPAERPSTPQRMMAYKLIGLKYWAEEDVDQAKHYLGLAEHGTVCSTWPQSIWAGALNSIIGGDEFQSQM